MKHLAYFLSAAIILLVASCGKENMGTRANATLPGKWKVIGSMISAGGPQYFVPATGKDYVEFKTDGTLSGSAFPNYKTYTVKDSITITMTEADNITYENYLYRIKGDSLTLGPAGPNYCIEGCAVKLVKE